MKKIGIVCLVFIGLICLVGCTKEQTQEESKLDKVLKENNYIVVDVRTPEEYAEGHVKESINIPYDEIDENTNLDKNKTILVYCKSGVRSNKAYNTLKELGYDVIDLGAYDKVELEKE